MPSPHTLTLTSTLAGMLHTFSSGFLIFKRIHLSTHTAVTDSPVQLHLSTLPRVHGCHSLKVSVTVVEQREHGWCLILAQDPKPCQQVMCRAEQNF